MMDLFKIGTKKEMVFSILWMVVIVFLTLFLNLYWNPRFKTNEFNPDSTVFTYAGKLVTEGKLPYRDFWDHKPPAVFYVNALEILFMGTTPWASWWTNFVWVALTTIIFFIVLRKLTNTFSAIISSGVFLLTLMYPRIYSGGNLTEIYGLLPQILIVGTSFFFFTKGQKRWAFVLGLLTAIAFLFKQTCIALGISAAVVILYLYVRSGQLRKGVIRLGLFVIGMLLPVGLIAFIWFISGAFGELWDAVIAFNFVYTGTGISAATFSGMFQVLLAEFPLMPLTITALGGLIAYILHQRTGLFSSAEVRAKQDAPVIHGANPPQAKRQVFLVVFLALPFEVAFIAAGGRNYLHYYITILPVLAAATAYLYEQLTSLTYANLRVIRPITIGIVILLSLLWFFTALKSEKPQVGVRTSLSKPLYGNLNLPPSQLSEYVLNNSRPDESILVWGNTMTLYLSTGRRNSSYYLYPQPLFLPRSGPLSRFDQFLQDLRQDPPALIIGPTHPSPDLPFINLPDDQLCPNCIPEAVEGMKRFKTMVTEQYALVFTDAYDVVYKRVH